MKLTEEEYRHHCDCWDGYCETCDTITRFGLTEPDLEEVECEECGEPTVMGMLNALMEGHIEIAE